MAQSFDEWLFDLRQEIELLDESTRQKSIIVVGFVGKDTEERSCSDLINGFLRKKVFSLSRYDFDENPSYIEAFYDPSGTLFLLLHNSNESNARNFLFSSNSKDKTFFEKIEASEIRFTQLLYMLSIFCHIIVFLDEGCRFDLDLIRSLSSANAIRQISNPSIRGLLVGEDGASSFPKEWAKSGRFSLPRLVFVFQRNPIRQDLALDKKKEMLENMEKHLENQISILLKKNNIIDCGHNAFGTITINTGQPFVYIFSHKEAPIDMAKELMKILYNPNPAEEMSIDQIIRYVDTRLQKQKEREDQNRPIYDFNFFLKNAIGNVRKAFGPNLSETKKEKTKKEELTLTTLYNFVSGANLIWNWFYSKNDEDLVELANYIDLNQKINPEFTHIKRIADLAITHSLSLYNSQLEKQSSLTVCGDRAFSTEEHKKTVERTIEHLRQNCQQSGAQRLEELAERLRNECSKVWLDGHVRCEALSLTGRLCHFAAHKLPGEETNEEAIDAITLRKNPTQHSSGYKTFTFCNCGKSRLERQDPFKLKEANYDFFQNAVEQFKCCSSFECFEFPTFLALDFGKEQQQTFLSSEDDENEEKNHLPRADDVNYQPIALLHRGKKYSSTSSAEDENPDSDILPNPQEYNIRFFDDEDEDIPNYEAEDEGKSATNAAEDYSKEKRRSVDSSSKNAFHEETFATGAAVSSEEEDEEEEASRSENANDFPNGESDIEEEAYEESDEEKDEDGLKKRKRAFAMANYHLESSSQESLLDGGSVSRQNRTRGEAGRKRLQTQSESEHSIASGSGGGGRERSNSTGSSSVTMKRQPQPKCVTNEAENLIEKFKGRYLEGMPHSQSPRGLLPLFPSFSLICLGQSGLYQHRDGLGDAIHSFRSGSEYLLPYDFKMEIDPTKWLTDMQKIYTVVPEQTYNHLVKQKQRLEDDLIPVALERVKLFVGFEYECPRGHRFMLQEYGKVMHHRRNCGGMKMSADPLIDNDQAIWMPCPCKRRFAAQLMRIHVVTPKAPVTVDFSVRIQADRMDEQTGSYFHPGIVAEAPIQLSMARYYVMRLPYVYLGPSGDPVHAPSYPDYQGRLIRNCIKVRQISLP